MPYPWLPPRGKTEKKAVFSKYCGDETTTYSNRAFLFRLSLSLSLHIFRWRALWLRSFIGYWSVKESINHFLSYDTAFQGGPFDAFRTAVVSLFFVFVTGLRWERDSGMSEA